MAKQTQNTGTKIVQAGLLVGAAYAIYRSGVLEKILNVRGGVPEINIFNEPSINVDPVIDYAAPQQKQTASDTAENDGGPGNGGGNEKKKKSTKKPSPIQDYAAPMDKQPQNKIDVKDLFPVQLKKPASNFLNGVLDLIRDAVSDFAEPTTRYSMKDVIAHERYAVPSAQSNSNPICCRFVGDKTESDELLVRNIFF